MSSQDGARSARIEPAASGAVSVAGALTFRTARRSCQAGIDAFERSSGDILVDCAGVQTADSAGLAVLIEWRRWAHGHGRVLKFVNLPAAISGIASISELPGVLEDQAAGN